MRFLGIDYGTKRIGLAISDESRTIAFPKEIILNDAKAYQRISKVVEGEDIGGIVVGESVDFKGKANILASRVEIFIKELKEKHNIPIYKEKEFLTSVEARKGINTKEERNAGGSHKRTKKDTSEKVDAKAAALILQRYLDRKNNIK
jgi:putative Holliday junction resolvase